MAENEENLAGGDDRRLPKLLKGMKIKYHKYGEGTVIMDEAIGSCVIDFDNKGVRDVHMGISHHLIEILEE